MSDTGDISNLVPNLQHLTALYTFLHVAGGLVGLPVIIATTLLSKRASRHPTMINLFVTLVIYSVSYLLLIFGRQQNEEIDPAVPSKLCQAQQALVHGTPTMASTAGLVVVIQMWTSFRTPQRPVTMMRPGWWPHSIRLTVSLAVPYVVFVAYTTASGVLGTLYPETVNASNGLYCTILKDPFRQYAVPSYTAAVMVLVIIFEVLAGTQLYRSWSSISRMFPLARRQTSLYMFSRVVVFNVYSVVTLCASVLFLTDALSPWPYFIQAGLPLAATLVFGTQKDLLQAWHILPSESTHSTHSSMASIAIPSARPKSQTRESVTEMEVL